ncbi:MAG: hypothetical protein ACPGPE_13080 [Planctomycetota bacterium]
MPPPPRRHAAGKLLNEAPVHGFIGSQSPAPIRKRVEHFRLERIGLPPRHGEQRRLEARGGTE